MVFVFHKERRTGGDISPFKYRGRDPCPIFQPLGVTFSLSLDTLYTKERIFRYL